MCLTRCVPRGLPLVRNICWRALVLVGARILGILRRAILAEILRGLLAVLLRLLARVCSLVRAGVWVWVVG